MLAYVCYVTEPSCSSVFCECERKQKFPFIILRWIIWLSHIIRCMSLSPKTYFILTYYQLHFWFNKIMLLVQLNVNLILFENKNWYYMKYEIKVTCIKQFVLKTITVFCSTMRTAKITVDSFLKTKSFFLKNLT